MFLKGTGTYRPFRTAATYGETRNGLVLSLSNVWKAGRQARIDSHKFNLGTLWRRYGIGMYPNSRELVCSVRHKEESSGVKQYFSHYMLHAFLPGIVFSVKC